MTNFDAVSKNFEQLRYLTKRLADKEEKEKYTKKEMLLWERERQKLDRFYGGIADLKSIPDAVFIIDTHLEDLAVAESKKMGVTTVGIVDTNADPEGIDYPIPANDDAVGSIKLITTYIIDAWIEGKKKAIKTQSEEAQKEVKVTKEPEEKKMQDTKGQAKVKEAKQEAKSLLSANATIDKQKPVKKVGKKSKVAKEVIEENSGL